MAGSSVSYLASKLWFLAVLAASGALSAIFLHHFLAVAVLLSITPVFALVYTANAKGAKDFVVRLLVGSALPFIGAALASPTNALSTLTAFPLALATATLVCSLSLTLGSVMKKEVSVFLALLVLMLLLSSVFLVEFIPFKNYTLIQVAVDLNPFSAFFYGVADFDWFHSESMYNRIGSYYPYRLPTLIRTLVYYAIASVTLLGLFLLSRRIRRESER